MVQAEQARSRLARWLEVHPTIDQTVLGRAVGRSQGWVSNRNVPDLGVK
jgi:hypothetical protein